MDEELNSSKQREKILGIKVPDNSLSFNQDEFKELLADSIVISFDDKLQLIAAVPNMKQENIDGLLDLLQQERDQFVAIDAEQVDKLKALAKSFSEKQKKLSDLIDSKLKNKEERAILDEIKQEVLEQAEPTP